MKNPLELRGLNPRIPAEYDDRLILLSEKTGKPKAYFLREIFIEVLKAREDNYRALEIAQRPHTEKSHLATLI